MPSMTFRFSTECEMTLCGQTYEEIYLRLKDFQHGDLDVPSEAKVKILPPETQQIFFSLDRDPTWFEISEFKGGFLADIVSHCDASKIVSPAYQKTGLQKNQALNEAVAEVYW